MGSIYEAMRITTKPRETCGELYESVREQYGISLRGFQMRFANVTGNSFAKNREVTAKEKAAIREAYPKKEILKRTATVRMKAGESPALKAAPGYLSRLLKWIVNLLPTGRKVFLLSALIIPTLASVSNTLTVSHALSNNYTTAMLITGVTSATALLFLWAGVRSFGSIAVVALTLGFEAFCNACSVFKALMGSMAYGLTIVAGKPSPFLDMVANFTGRDHQDAATWIAGFVAVMIAGAQVSALYELKR